MRKTMFKPAFWWALLCLPALMVASPAMAQSAPSSVNAVVAIAPPLVMEKDGQLTGFSIDLWNAIAGKLNLKTNYVMARDVAAVADVMRSGKADVVAVPSYYTTQRDIEFDYTFPTLNAGMLIMVPGAAGGASSNPLMDLVHLIISPGMLMWLGVGMLLLLIPAHIFWLLDRGSEDSISPDKRYFPGIFHAMVWAASALVSQVQQMPAGGVARVLALVWMFVGVVFIAFYTAQLTTDLTVQQINGLINGPGDLPGKRVGTVSGTVAADYLKEIGADVSGYATIDEMFGALQTGKVDAIVQAAPMLRYYATNGGAGRVRIVGDEFRKADLAYLVQLNSPLRRRINAAVIAIHEDGTYDQIYGKWFGGS